MSANAQTKVSADTRVLDIVERAHHYVNNPKKGNIIRNPGGYLRNALDRAMQEVQPTPHVPVPRGNTSSMQASTLAQEIFLQLIKDRDTHLLARFEKLSAADKQELRKAAREEYGGNRIYSEQQEQTQMIAILERREHNSIPAELSSFKEYVEANGLLDHLPQTKKEQVIENGGAILGDLFGSRKLPGFSY